MILIKNKLRKRLRGLIGIALASFLILSALCISAFAETSNIVSDIMPDGTNIPDTDIGGATGMDGTTPLGTLPESLPDTSNGTIPQSNVSSTVPFSTSAPGDDDATNNVGRVLGIIIAVIVVLAVIVLIIALIPKKDKYSNDQRKK